jgi:hypothetical protein
MTSKALQHADRDEPILFGLTGNNLGLQQQIRRHFVTNSPFRITTSPSEIRISQVGNIMTVEVDASRIPNGYEVAKHVWSTIREKMIGAGWSLLLEENYYHESNLVCFFVGGDALLNGKLPT